MVEEGKEESAERQVAWAGVRGEGREGVGEGRYSGEGSKVEARVWALRQSSVLFFILPERKACLELSEA